MTLSEALRLRYPHDDYLGVDLRKVVEKLCKDHIDSGLGDGNTEQRLCAEDDPTYWQQFSEVLLAHELTKAGIGVVHRKMGPDFLLDHEGRRIWIEIITPKPVGIDSKWLKRNVKVALSMPHEAILLRWSSAIKEKAEKLLGNPEKNLKGYLQKNVVGPNDAYVIAVNGYLLRHPPWPQVLGISQFPFAVEATLCVGPIQVFIDRETLKTAGQEHQQRTLIPKPNGAQIPADTFLDPKFSAISAIWAVDIDENLLLGRSQPMSVVHNPMAINPAPEKFLPAQSEYLTVNQGDSYLLEWRDGRLRPDGDVMS